LSCTILKFIFSLVSNLGTYIPYLISVANCSKEKKIEEKKKTKFQSTSPCMFNVHSIFICFCTMLLIVGHHWVELEVPLYFSFDCCSSLKIESLIICITTCYFHRNNKLQSSCLGFITFILEDEHGLSLGMLMYLKFMHELYSLLLHIPTYLHVMRCYNHGLHWFRAFSKQSPLFWFELSLSENVFFSVFDFPGATGLEKGQGQGERLGNFKANDMRWRGPPGDKRATNEMG
jgi:hypothetical protein